MRRAGETPLRDRVRRRAPAGLPARGAALRDARSISTARATSSALTDKPLNAVPSAELQPATAAHGLLLWSFIEISTGHYQSIAAALGEGFPLKLVNAVNDPSLFAELQLLAARRSRLVFDFEASRDHLDKALAGVLSMTGRALRCGAPCRAHRRPAPRQLRRRARAAPGRRRGAAASRPFRPTASRPTSCSSCAPPWPATARISARSRRTFTWRWRRWSSSSSRRRANRSSHRCAYNELLGAEVLRGDREAARKLLQVASAAGQPGGHPAAGIFRRCERIQLRRRRRIRPPGPERPVGQGMGRAPEAAAAMDHGSGEASGSAGLRPGSRRPGTSADGQDGRGASRVDRGGPAASRHPSGALSKVGLRLAPALLDRSAALRVRDRRDPLARRRARLRSHPGRPCRAEPLRSRRAPTMLSPAEALQASDEKKRIAQSVRTIEYQRAGWEKAELAALAGRLSSPNRPEPGDDDAGPAAHPAHGQRFRRPATAPARSARATPMRPPASIRWRAWPR